MVFNLSRLLSPSHLAASDLHARTLNRGAPGRLLWLSWLCVAIPVVIIYLPLLLTRAFCRCFATILSSVTTAFAH